MHILFDSTHQAESEYGTLDVGGASLNFENYLKSQFLPKFFISDPNTCIYIPILIFKASSISYISRWSDASLNTMMVKNQVFSPIDGSKGFLLHVSIAASLHQSPFNIPTSTTIIIIY